MTRRKFGDLNLVLIGPYLSAFFDGLPEARRYRIPGFIKYEVKRLMNRQDSMWIDANDLVSWLEDNKCQA